MKKRIVLCTVTLLLLCSTSFCGISFDGLGAGAQLSFVVPERDNLGGDGPAFGFGFQGMAEFDVGRFGALQYVPSFTFWFKPDKWTYNSVRVEELEGQVTLNLFDIKYFPPLADIFIKLYVGISPLPCIVINTYHREDDNREITSWRDADPGFNIFGGIDFPVSDVIVPYFEWRMTLSHKWAMRLSGGLMICFL